MDTPRVTVCIVTRNQKNYIELCIQSIIDQVADIDLKILVGDDASEDGTSDIVARFATSRPDVVTHILHPSRIGAFANIRDLMARADGDFIARVDGDDYWLPGKLQRQVEFLLQHPDYVAVYTDAITIDEKGRCTGRFNGAGDLRLDIASLLRNGNFLNNSSVLFRSGCKDAWLVTEAQIDYRVHLWHARHGRLAQIGEPLTAYRINATGSIVADANDRIRQLYWEAIMSVPRGLVADDDFANGLADFLRRVAFRAARTRNPNLLRTWTSRVLAASPYSHPRTLWMVTVTILKTAAHLIYLGCRRIIQGKRYRILYPH